MSELNRFSYASSGNQAPVSEGLVEDVARPQEAAPVDEKPKKEKKMKTKTNKGSNKGLKVALSVVAAVLVVAVAAAGLLVYGVVPMPGVGGGGNTYSVDSAQTLLKYLNHPSLQAGDTLVIKGSMQVDIDEAFDGFASIPLVNFDCSGGALTFSGGTAYLSGGDNSANLNGVTFSGTKVYVNAPATAVTWDSAPADAVVNAKSLNGSAAAQDLGVYVPGSRFTLPVTFKNESGGALSDVEVNLSSLHLIFADGNTHTIESLGAGESVTVDLEVVAIEAGRVSVGGYASDESGNLLVSVSSEPVTVIGEGFYAGDVHTHTVASESQRFGTVEGNIKNGFANGMSFIVSVENNLEPQILSQSQVDSLVGEPNAFLQLRGFEAGEELKHMIVLGTDIIPDTDFVANGIDQWTYQNAVDQVTTAGGMVIMPHPYDYAEINEQIGLSKSILNVTGLEVLNQMHGMDDIETRVALNVWRIYKAFGNPYQPTYGIAASNNMYSEQVGTRFIQGRMNGLDEQSVYAMLQSGCYYWSNGPQVWLNIGGAEAGGTFATAEGGATKAKMFAQADSAITELTLERFTVTGTRDDLVSEVIFSEDFTGKNVYSFSETIDVTVNPKEFYILTVKTEKSAEGNDYGYAATNPVVSTASTKADVVTNGAALDKIGYLIGGSVEQAPNGTYYIDGRAFIPQLFSVGSANNNVVFDYHKMNNDALADYVNVSITNADGTRTVERVWLV